MPVALVVLIIVPIIVVRLLGVIFTPPIVRQLQASWPAEDPLDLQESNLHENKLQRLVICYKSSFQADCTV